MSTPRTVARVAGRLLLGFLVAIFLAGAVLVVLAFYAGATFDVEEAGIAIVVAGVLVVLWSRWR